MSNEVAKQVATNELTARGFQVEPIDRGEGKTADLLVTGQNSKYLIEAKDRQVDPEVNERRQEHFAAGKMFINSDAVAYDNNISTALRDARRQLNATPKEPGTFQLIWFHATELDIDHKYRRLLKTFYGHAWLCPVDGNESVHCLYFHFNLAYDMRDVEAVIVSHKNLLQVCLNGFADRIDEFRESELCQTYAWLGLVFDPHTEIASGEYIACTADISRKDSEAVLKALESQTGICYRMLPELKHHTFEIGPSGAEYPDEINHAQLPMTINAAQLAPILDEFVTTNPSPYDRQNGSIFTKVSFDDLDDSARCQLAKFFILRNTPYIGTYSGNLDAPHFLARAAAEISTWPMGSEVSGRRLEHIAYALDIVAGMSFTTPPGALASVYLLHQLEFFFRKLSGVLHADGCFIDLSVRPSIKQQLGLKNVPKRIDNIALAYKIMLLKIGIMAVDTFRELDQQSMNTPMPDGSTIETVGDRVTYFRHTVSHGEFGDPSAEGTYYGLLTAIAVYGSDIFPRK